MVPTEKVRGRHNVPNAKFYEMFDQLEFMTVDMNNSVQTHPRGGRWADTVDGWTLKLLA